MEATYRPGPDGYDIWSLVNAGGSLLSILSLISDGKTSRELGAVGTILSAGSAALHKLIVPPRCACCGIRMQQPAPTTNYKWYCPCCGACADILTG
jgi:hypothetical protein